MKSFRHAFASALVAASLVAAGCRTPAPTTGAPSSGAAASSAPSGAASTGTYVASPGAHASGAPAAFTVPRESFPTKVGTHYVMQWTQYQGEAKIREWKEDTRIDKVDGDLLTYTVVSEQGGQPQKTQLWAIERPDGIWMRTNEPPKEAGKTTHQTEGGSMVFKFPMKPGDSWEIRMPQGTMATREVVGKESITVPAGTFEAVRIKEKREGSTGDSWYVPDIGIVKSDLAGPGGRFVKELAKYEPAK